MPSTQKTTNLKLNKWQGNEYAKRTDFVDDNEKIDAAYGELEKQLKNMKLESTAIDVVDTANNFTADSAGKKILEDVLVQINTKVEANSTELNGQRTKAINLYNRLDKVF